MAATTGQSRARSMGMCAHTVFVESYALGDRHPLRDAVCHTDVTSKLAVSRNMTSGIHCRPRANLTPHLSGSTTAHGAVAVDG